MKAKLCLFTSIAMLMTACGGEHNHQNSKPADTSAVSANANLPTYRVAIEPLYPPFVQQAPQGAEGFDVDLLNAIAEKEGFKINYVPMPWSGLFASLDNNEADIVAGGMAISEDRQAKMDFTEPYYETEIVLLVDKDSPIQSFENARGKKISYQSGTSTVPVIKSQLGEPNPELASDSAWLSVKDMLSDKSDAAIGHSGSFKYYAHQYQKEGLRVVSNPNLPKEMNAFAIKKGNTELQAKLNKGLAAIKADGTYDKLYQKWMSNSQPTS